MACFRVCLECFQGPSYTATASYSILDEQNKVKLDTSHIGTDVVIVKNGHRICGSGAALGNAPLVQNKAYFEVKIQQTGVWGVGVALRGIDLNKIPLGCENNSWVLRQDGKFYTGNEVMATLNDPIEEGDVIGIAYDHVDLQFFKNGEPLHTSLSGIKNQVYPVVYVDDGAIVDVQFSAFWFSPPKGFEEIMVEQTIL